MWMNQADIESAYFQEHQCPNIRKGIKLLYRLMNCVNECSDGWAYWHAPSKAAEQLMELLQEKGNVRLFCRSGTITEEELKKAIIPIRRMVTVQRKKQKNYGIVFDFDVDKALN